MLEGVAVLQRHVGSSVTVTVDPRPGARKLLTDRV
jgi:hypothetical protein